MNNITKYQQSLIASILQEIVEKLQPTTASGMFRVIDLCLIQSQIDEIKSALEKMQ